MKIRAHRDNSMTV